MGANEEPVVWGGALEAEEPCHETGGEALDEDGGANDRVDEGLHQGGVASWIFLLSEGQCKERGHGGGNDSAGGDPAEEAFFPPVE